MQPRTLLQITCLAAGGLALASLVTPLVAEAGLTLETALHVATTSGLVGLTIVSGISAHAMWAGLRWQTLAALLLGLIALAGSALIVAENGARRAQSSDQAAAVAAEASSRRARLQAELVRSRAMLAEAQRGIAAECASGAGAKCKGRQATEMVYRNAIAGLEAQLASAPVAAPSAKQARARQIATLFDYDPDRAALMVATFDPFALPLWLELLSVVAGIFGFTVAQPGNVSAGTAGNAGNAGNVSAGNAGNDNYRAVTIPVPTGVAQPRILLDHERIIAALEANGGAFANQRALARAMGVSPGEASKMLAGCHNVPRIVVETDGRQNRVRLKARDDLLVVGTRR